MPKEPMSRQETSESVGPVLIAGDAADEVVRAIRASNPDVVVQSRGAYVRVMAPGCCLLRRAAIERESGQPFRLPGDLERIMPSFSGFFRVSEEEAVWTHEKP